MSWSWSGLPPRPPRGRHRQPRLSVRARLALHARELAEQVAVRFTWGMCAVVIALCAWHVWGAS